MNTDDAMVLANRCTQCGRYLAGDSDEPRACTDCGGTGVPIGQMTGADIDTDDDRSVAA